MPRDDRPPPRKPLITSDRFDPAAMLTKARRGAYPSAGKRSTYRDEEIAYWRGRCGLAAEVDPAGEAPAAAPPPDDDADFLASSPERQRLLIRSYLLSEYEVDWHRGAALCALAGMRLPAEAHAAWASWHERMASWQRRQRLAAQAGRRRGGLFDGEG